MRTQHIGPEELLVGAKVEFDAGLTSAGIAEAINATEARVREARADRPAHLPRARHPRRARARRMTTAVVHGPGLQAYNPSDDDGRPLRRELGIELMDAYGLRDGPGALRVDPPPARVEDVERVHAPAYVRAVRRLSDSPVLAAAPEAAQWGLQPGGDTPARAGMHEAAAGGVRRVADGRRPRVGGPGGTRLLPGARRAAPRPRAARRRASASTTTVPWRSGGCSTPAPSGSRTLTSTPTTATASSGSSTRSRGC